MSFCSVRWCEPTGEHQCFDIPENITLARKWMRFLKTTNGKNDESIATNIKICEQHFKQNQILKGFSVTLLVPGAVPTIAVIKKDDIPEIGMKPGVTILPRLYEPDEVAVKRKPKMSQATEMANIRQVPRISRVKESKAISQVCKETGMCGSCLVVTGTAMNKISMAASMAFKEITEFETLSEFICDNCSITLRNYIVFKSLMKQKHRQIRADLDKSNFMGKQLEDIDLSSNEALPKFNCKSCEFKTFTLQSLAHHEKSKHSGCQEQQPFQKIQIQVADEDYDFMAKILNRNQLEQVKITENTPAPEEEASSSSLPFKISKVDSWAPYVHVSLEHQEAVVKKKKKRKIPTPTNAEKDPLGDDSMSSSEFVMKHPQNCKQVDEKLVGDQLDELVEVVKPKKRKKAQPLDDSLPFYCDLCGYSSGESSAILEHIHQAHPGTSNGTGKLSLEIPPSKSSAD